MAACLGASPSWGRWGLRKWSSDTLVFPGTAHGRAQLLSLSRGLMLPPLPTPALSRPRVPGRRRGLADWGTALRPAALLRSAWDSDQGGRSAGQSSPQDGQSPLSTHTALRHNRKLEGVLWMSLQNSRVEVLSPRGRPGGEALGGDQAVRVGLLAVGLVPFWKRPTELPCVGAGGEVPAVWRPDLRLPAPSTVSDQCPWFPGLWVLFQPRTDGRGRCRVRRGQRQQERHSLGGRNWRNVS